jgi:quinol monooxygenase YgiN
MPTASDNRSVVLINVFTVAPQDQQQLINLLTRATDGSVDREPGFISATLHRSLDGTKVTMYAKWKDAASYNAMRHRPARPFLEQAIQIAKFEPAMYEVVRTFLPSRPQQSD